EVGRPALELSDQRQASATRAAATPEHADIAGAVTDEGEAPRRHIGDHDLSRGSRGLELALGIHDLDDDVLCRDVHATGGAFRGDEARVAPAVAVCDGTAENAPHELTLLWVEAPRGYEGDAHRQILEPLLLTHPQPA